MIVRFPGETGRHDPDVDDGIAEVIVAAPARDEQDTIADCIRSVDAAAARAGRPTHLVIAADSCHDRTAAIAAGVAVRHLSLSVLEGTWGGAGAARRAAVAHGLATSRSAGREPRRVWIANTDADTVVPTDWLTTQLAHASTHDAVAGVVDLDPRFVSSELLARFRAAYRVRDDRHEHVHGANLGVRADLYLDAGGWCPLTTVGEDHGLWNRLVAIGAATCHSIHLRVVTSGRIRSRVDGGFATDLRALTPDGAGGCTEDAGGAAVASSGGRVTGEGSVDELVA